jgi:hypothetical protein
MADQRIDKPVFELTDEELDAKIQKLTRIVFSNNVNLARQAQPILMGLYEEQSRRNAEKFEKHLEKQGVKMDDIINIG